MTVDTAAASAEIDRLCRRLRMPYVRRHVHDVVATAKAQRWDPAEVVRVLLDEEARGRDASTIEIRRRRAAFPAGKTFDTFDPARFSIPAATQRRPRLTRVGRPPREPRRRRTIRHRQEPLLRSARPQPRSTPTSPSPGSASNSSAGSSPVTASTTRITKAFKPVLRSGIPPKRGGIAYEEW